MATKKDWQQFITTGQIPPSLSSIIADSWEYCRSIQLNHLIQSQPLSGRNWAYIKRSNKPLLETAVPLVKEFLQLDGLKSNQLVGILADRNGYILESINSAESTYMPHNIPYPVGTRFSEDTAGTTAISLVQKYLVPIQVSGYEHYCQMYHNCFCSAAPIFNTAKELMGIFSLVGPKESATEHTLSVATAISTAISSLHQAHLACENLTEKEKLYTSILDSVSDGVIVLDEHGIIRYINPCGAKSLHFELDHVLNKQINAVCDFEPVITHALRTGKGYSNREVLIETKETILDFIKTAIILKDDAGKITGAIDIFREAKQIRSIVPKVVGATTKYTFDDIIGNAPATLEAVRLAKIASENEANILITGETGTGKELFAQAIHHASSRRHGPFITLNCGAIPRNLIESELFGYDTGAFTGAKTTGQAGKFEMSHGGTIFLDEIGDMPLEMQVHLLRIIEDKRVMRLGGNRYIDINTRILAATNKDLFEEVHKGTFRADLYYRLNVLGIFIPPLRQRQSDIPLLISNVLHRICSHLDIEDKTIDKETMSILLDHHWSGNIRELDNTIERMVYICPHKIITKDYLPLSATQSQKPVTSFSTIPLAEFEKDYISKVYAHNNSNISKTAKSLGISRNTLYKKLRDMGLPVQS